MKRLFILITSLITVSGFLCASDIQIDGIWYDFDHKKGTATVTFQGEKFDDNLNEYTGSVIIPTSVIYNDQEYIVKSIGDFAFGWCSDLTSVTIPNSVTSIGESAFRYCTNLTSVNIPNSITSIGDKAFNSCSRLAFPIYNSHLFAYLPASFTGTYEIPDGIQSITDGAFCNCSGLTSIIVPNSVVSIATNAFDLANNVVYNGTAQGAPWGAKSINGHVEGVLIYGDYTKKALLGCSSAANGKIIIPKGVSSIGNYAFYNCSNITYISIPNSVKSIGDYAFYNCPKLTLLTIPNSVTSVGEHAIPDDANLSSDLGNLKIDASLFDTSNSGEKDFHEDPTLIFSKNSSHSTAECSELAKSNPEEGLKCFLRGYPKKVVAIQGDYSILYNRKCVCFFDFNYDNATEVICEDEGIGTINCIEHNDFSYYLERNNLTINNDSIAKIVCKKFNDKLLVRKCSLYPVSYIQNHTTKKNPESKYYTLTLNIDKIDSGFSDGDFMENRLSQYRGTTISGNIEIRPIDSDSVCCTLIVDRVNALWAPNAIERITNAIEDIITDKLFFVKEFYIYPKL